MRVTLRGYRQARSEHLLLLVTFAEQDVNQSRLSHGVVKPDNMRGVSIAMLIVTILAGCGSRNEQFSPFDDEYEFHTNFKLSDYDTIDGQCGYWNLTNRNDGTYYQFFLNEKRIVAKGFDIVIDELEVEYSGDEPNSQQFIDALKRNPIDTNRIKAHLEKYNPKAVMFLYDTTSLTGLKIVDQRDSVHLAAVEAFWNGQRIERTIGYFNVKY